MKSRPTTALAKLCVLRRFCGGTVGLCVLRRLGGEPLRLSLLPRFRGNPLRFARCSDLAATRAALRAAPIWRQYAPSLRAAPIWWRHAASLRVAPIWRQRAPALRAAPIWRRRAPWARACLGSFAGGPQLASSLGPLGNSFQCAHRHGRGSGQRVDPPPLKWSDLRYVFDIKEDCNGKEAIQA
jgi:hypothetical protein